jgi:type VI secretion system protein ImpE
MCQPEGTARLTHGFGPAQLLAAAKLKEAIESLGAEIRQHPTDARLRTFLFELLAFAGEFDRAEKHLTVLAQTSRDADLGALLYRSALSGERQRQQIFKERSYPAAVGSTGPGTLNGKPFQTIEDADPRIGARLEIFVAGEYVWLPFEHVGSVIIEPPRLFRDLIWATARVVTGPSFQGRELGEVIVPVLYPQSFQHARDEVKLGRATEWEDTPGGPVPFGQKMLLVDGEEMVPYLEIRHLQFVSTEASPEAAASPAP